MIYNAEVSEKTLKSNYEKACMDSSFKKLVHQIGASDKTAMKYTSSLENTVKELGHCAKCPGLMYCENRLEGHVFYPTVDNKQIIFSYAPCKKKREFDKAASEKSSRDKDLRNAKMADIEIDKERKDVVKWMKNFYDTYNVNGNFKGLYLHGNFGCGKTYLIAALFNELAKKKIRTEIVYFPKLLADIKNDFDSFGDTLEYLEDVDLLLIDDIGAEKVTEWSRDEVLGTILQQRMNNYKTTFFTSNLDLEQLEEHLKLNNYSDDEIKCRRILQRVKQLSEEMQLIGENKRK